MRRGVRSNVSDNSNRSDEEIDSNEKEERMIGVGDSLPTTLTHSLLLFIINILLFMFNTNITDKICYSCNKKCKRYY